MNEKRMYELEFIKDFFKKEDLTEEEKDYIKRSKKMPYFKTVEYINFYFEHCNIVKSEELINCLQNIFQLAEEEVVKRVDEICLLSEFRKNLYMDFWQNIDAKRMLELERILKTNPFLQDIELSSYDILYIEYARKISLDDLKQEYEYFMCRIPEINIKVYLIYLLKKYSCTKEELVFRYKMLLKILRYRNKALNEMVEVRKKMIKKMENL